MTQDKESKNKVPRTFLSPAFLVQVEPKLYGLYRSVEIEAIKKDGTTYREKIKDIGPIALFREAEGDEEVDMQTFHPIDKRPMALKRVEL